MTVPNSSGPEQNGITTVKETGGDNSIVTKSVASINSAQKQSSSNELFVVGVGASAGGLKALELLFDHVPIDTGKAYVVIQHLSPDFKSMMLELLSLHTHLSIYRVEDGMKVEPNSVYLIPPKKEMIISDGRLLLNDKDPTRGISLPIDKFFRSLAIDCKTKAIGVILSGGGSDGSRGIVDISQQGGLVIAQDEGSCRFDWMPRAAIKTGFVDYILRPEDIGKTIDDHCQSFAVPNEALQNPIHIVNTVDSRECEVDVDVNCL